MVGLVLALALLAGCDAGPPPQVMAPPPPSVVAVAAKMEPIREESQFVGRVTAIERVELRARVEGFLEERSFTEGQPVAVGDVLFLIEPDQYAAVVAQREADLEKAKADAQNADAQLARAQELVEKKNIAQARVDELEAAALVARASVAQAEAALGAAQLDLGYTRIQAPVAGRIGLSQHTVGNLVGPSSGVLATIVSRDPIHVEFPVTQRELLEARRDIAAKGGDVQRITVRARLPDDNLYEHPGHLDFVDVTTNRSTDSVTLRASLPNPDGLLVDGQYVGVVVEAAEAEEAILIPQSAVQIDQQGASILIVDADGQAQARRIETGADQGGDVVVRSGLREGELVITEGLQKVRPGQAVAVAPARLPGGGAAP